MGACFFTSPSPLPKPEKPKINVGDVGKSIPCEIVVKIVGTKSFRVRIFIAGLFIKTAASILPFNSKVDFVVGEK